MHVTLSTYNIFPHFACCCLLFCQQWEFCVDTGEEAEVLKLTDLKSDENQPSRDYDCEEDALLIDLLGKFAPLNSDSKAGLPEMYESYSSLRLLLLKKTSTRSVEENGVLKLLKHSYKNYLVSGRKENEIASFLVQEWMVLRTSLRSHLQQVDASAIHFQPNLYHRNYDRDKTKC
jgi:hypothetical protein